MIPLNLFQFPEFDERPPDLPAGSQRVENLERLIESRGRLGVFTRKAMCDCSGAVNDREIELMLVARRELFRERRIHANSREIALLCGNVRQDRVQIMLVRPRSPFDRQ